MYKQIIENSNDINVLQNLHFILFGTKSRENLNVLKRNILKGLPFRKNPDKHIKKIEQIRRELTTTEIQNLLSMFGENNSDSIETLFEILNNNEEELIDLEENDSQDEFVNSNNELQIQNLSPNITVLPSTSQNTTPVVPIINSHSISTDQQIYQYKKNILELEFEMEETQLLEPNNEKKLKLLDIKIRKQKSLLDLKQNSIEITNTPTNSMPTSKSFQECNMALDIRKMLSRQSVGNSLRNFDGSSKFEWPAFLSEYNMTTKLCSFSHEENILRLNNSLKGNARQYVEMLLVTTQNPQDIIDILASVYGKPEDISQEIVQKARQLPRLTDCKSFQNFEIGIRNIISAAKNVDPQYQRESELLSIFVSKLPEHLIIQWGSYLLNRSSTSSSNDLSVFNEWVKGLADIFSKIGVLQNSDDKYPKSISKSLCVVCKNSYHTLTKCPQFISGSVTQRWNYAKETKVCFCCLKNHSSPCTNRRKCGINNCTRFHHEMLHKNASESSIKTQVTRSMASKSSENNIVLLKLLPVKIFGSKGVVTVTAFLDEGSNVSLIDANLAKDLGIEGPVKPLCINWTGDISRYDSDSKNTSFPISGTQNNAKIYNIHEVRTVDDLSLPGQFINSEDLLEKFPYITNVDLKNIDWKNPKILIGQDNADLIVTLQCIQPQPNSFILSKTKLGWTVHGNSKLHQPIFENTSISQCTICDDDLHELVKGFFGFEVLSNDKPNVQISESDDDCVNQVKRSIKYTGSKFEVKLPWKDANKSFPDTYPLAFSRLKCLLRKIKKEHIENAYNLEIQKLLDKKYAVPVLDEELLGKEVWYLSHFGVTNPKKPGKTRVVFDAAAKVSGKSLNDYLYSGPDLLTSIVGVLLQFRLYKYGFVGDVREMFNQVQIDYDDSFAQCFLWQNPLSADKPLVYRMQAMLFGITSSPFISQFVKNYNADRFQNEFPTAVKAIKDNTYVDDFIFGRNTEEEAIKLFNDVINIQASGGFELRNCLSNSRNIMKSIPQNLVSEKYSHEIETKTTNPVLGLKWDAISDKLSFNSYFLISCDELFNQDVIPTKRQILKAIMSIYDPLGLLSPITIKGKMILQEVWRSKVNWDDLISQKCYEEWKIFRSFVKDIPMIEINRWYSKLLLNPDSIDIHIFCDASEAAYATAVYMRITKGCETDVVLVAAKARVAPLKSLTIPKMELMAAVLAVRLYNTVRKYLDLQFSKIYFWTDSTAVLGWIKGDKKLPTFVSNRVLEISQSSNPNDWFWISTNENIADLCTRGQIKMPLSKNDCWFNGPSFLQEREFKIVEQPTNFFTSTQVLVIAETTVCIPFQIKWNYSFIKILRITSWINRFKQSSKGQRFNNNILTSEELEVSLTIWIKMVQKYSFPKDISNILKSKPNKDGRLYNHPVYIDSQGLLRIQTRILNDEFVEFQDPICLDGKLLFVQRLITHYHKNFNHQCTEAVINELRKKYWIPKIRSVVKSVVHKCFVCQRLKCKALNPQMSSLPPERLLVNYKPFTATGIDYFGPFRIKIGRRVEKRYGCLFICLTSRAIHVEIVASLTSESCLLAIRRFIARRGQVKVIWSDNGKYFISTSKELQQAKEDISFDNLKISLSNIGIQWKFIPPYTPHMGGSWERLIGCFKRTIETVLKGSTVKEEMLQTIFAEAEYIVNSRPLTYSSSESGQVSITPNDILIGKTIQECTVNENMSNFQRMWRTTQHLIDEFWKRWLKEYLPIISLRSKWTQNTPPLKIGDIVVINDLNLPRYKWPIGIVIQVNNGADGIPRSVTVRTQHGEYKRAIHHLHRYISHDDTSFRVTLPLTVDEYQVAQLYSVAEASKNETGGGEGIEVLKNEPFSNHPLLGGKYSSGQYTYKIYHLASKVPAFIRLLAPKGSLEIHEEAWNAYPYCKTVITNPKFMKDGFKVIIDSLHLADTGDSENNPGYMKDNFIIIIESHHIADIGDQENVHELPPEKVKLREVIHIDISNDPVQPADYKPDEDPTKFKSEKTSRGPLVGADWKKKVDPVMTCYKLVTCEFKWFGLQSRIENFIQKSERRLFTNFHRQVFCWMDRWHGLTMEDIRAIEDKVKEELDKQRQEGEVRGTRADSD